MLWLNALMLDAIWPYALWLQYYYAYDDSVLVYLHILQTTDSFTYSNGCYRATGWCRQQLSRKPAVLPQPCSCLAHVVGLVPPLGIRIPLIHRGQHGLAQVLLPCLDEFRRSLVTSRTHLKPISSPSRRFQPISAYGT